MWRNIPLLLLPLVAAAEPSPALAEPQGALRLQHAIDAALANSPKLASFGWDVRIGDARVIQARLRPNPELSLEVENVLIGGGADRSTMTRILGVTPSSISLEPTEGGGQTAAPLVLRPAVSRGSGFAEFGQERQEGVGSFGNVEITLSLSQTIELGGKRAARIEAAERARDVVAWDYEVARCEVLGDTVVQFTEVLAAQQRVKEERGLVELADALTSTVSQMVEAGSVSPLEGRRARADAEQERLELIARERELDRARNRLAALWGSNAPAFTEAVGNVSATPALPPLDEILARRDEHPALKRWGAELARRGAMFREARSKRAPDLTVRVGLELNGADDGDASGWSLGSDGLALSRSRSGGDDWEHGLTFEASLPLPIFDRNQGAIREAELNREKLGDERRAWDVEIVASLTDRHAAAAMSLERIEGFEQRVLPELEKTYTLTQEGYRRGKFSFIDVLDARRAVVTARIELLEARINYHRAVAEMERVLGAGVVSLLEVPRLTNVSDDEIPER